MDKWVLGALWSFAVSTASLVAFAAEPLDAAVREPYAATLLPSAQGIVYAPRGDGLPLRYGGGAEIVLLTWSNDAPSFGPGMGKLRLDVDALGGGSESDWVIMYRGGPAVSFEGRPNRTWLVPYFSASFGGVHHSVVGGSAFADAGGGLYLVYVDGLILDAEAAYLFAFAEAKRLSGVASHLTLSISFW